MFEKAKRFAKKIATSKKAQMTCLMMVCGVTAMRAQTTAGDYSAVTAALTQVSEEIAKYVPIVVKLCYAIAGVVAVVGAISVYIAMNNEEQDVKNILVLQNWLERIRKEVTNKVLSIKRISDFLIFPILAQPTLKKI